MRMRSRAHGTSRMPIHQRIYPFGMALLLVALVSFLAPGLASAHAGYESSDPAAGAVLKTAPTTVTVHFAEEVNPTGSDIVVYDAKHQVVSTAPAQVDHNDLKTMTVSMKGNDSETYLVEWHNVSADDGDPDIGAFTFTVSSTATPSSGSSSGGQSASASGTPSWVVAVVGVAGLILGALGGMAFARRR